MLAGTCWPSTTLDWILDSECIRLYNMPLAPLLCPPNILKSHRQNYCNWTAWSNRHNLLTDDQAWKRRCWPDCLHVKYKPLLTYLSTLHTPGTFYVILYEWDNLYDVLFVLLYTQSLLKKGPLWKERLCFFPFRVDAFLKGVQKQLCQSSLHWKCIRSPLPRYA